MRSRLSLRFAFPSGLRKLAAAAGLGVTALALMAQYGETPVDPWWEAGNGRSFPMWAIFPDPSGHLMVLNGNGAFNTDRHPFFEAVGSNGRACVTCHQPSNAMSLGVAQIRERWTETHGTDPVFAAVDGSNCPTLPQAQPASHSLLLDRGLFRIYLPWPALASDGTPIHPEFTIQVVRDPTGCNTSPLYGLNSPHPAISVYRRPRVVGNLKFVLGREDLAQDAAISGAPASLAADGRDRTLEQQAAEAMHAHEQSGGALTAAQLRQIVDYESQVFVAQTDDNLGGELAEVDGPLGAWNLARSKVAQSNVQSDASHRALFLDANYWKSPSSAAGAAQSEFRASVARGNAIFTSRPFRIDGVANLATGKSPRSVTGTCGTCHTAPLSGSSLQQQAMDVGTTELVHSADLAGLPLFKITCDPTAAPHPYLGRVIYTTDPGRALVTGKCSDVGSIVMQQFRGLAARAPYFSNGSAKTLMDVVDYYDRRFNMALTPRDKQDLVNFLSAL
jgi:hypothetical protein